MFCLLTLGCSNSLKRRRRILKVNYLKIAVFVLQIATAIITLLM